MYGYRDKEEICEVCYRDTVFVLRGQEHYRDPKTYSVCDIKATGERVFLPDEYEGYKVDSIELTNVRDDKAKQYPGIRYLNIPKGCKSFTVSNRSFPDLEEIEVDAQNPKYSTDGKALLNVDGDTYMKALAAGNSQCAVVGKSVKTINSGAFDYTYCSDIVFENENIYVECGAFKESVWQNKHHEAIYIGNMLYKILAEMEKLVLPDKITRIHEKAFSDHIPKEIVSSVLPSARMFEQRYWSFSKGLVVLRYTGKKRKINWQSYRKLELLENIYLSANTAYKDKDGVIFSADMKKLIFYPSGRREKEYKIPDGVVTIGREAFSGAKYLEIVKMPDSVKKIQQGAFYSCEKLMEVKFSDNITEIPDATEFLHHGVFEGCRKLISTYLPHHLTHIGSWAFSGCHLNIKEFPEKLRFLGDYAFRNNSINEIRLPKTLMYLGEGALMGVKRVKAYEGTARGLISAIEGKENGQISWKGAEIVILDRKGEAKDIIRIPESLKHISGTYIEAAWNEDKFDYCEYDNCFDDITDKTEKIQFATEAIARGAELEDSPYEAYLKRMSLQVLKQLLTESTESRVVDFIKCEYLSRSGLKEALKLCNERGMNLAAAYILKLVNKDGNGRKTTAIRI